MPPDIKPDKKTEIEWGKDPANYRWGNYYYNKNDGRFWVKNWEGYYRGRGFIINFARPYATLFFIGFTLLFILVIVGIAYLTN
jgi:uncharacterized membrane protein